MPRKHYSSHQSGARDTRRAGTGTGSRQIARIEQIWCCWLLVVCPIRSLTLLPPRSFSARSEATFPDSYSNLSLHRRSFAHGCLVGTALSASHCTPSGYALCPGKLHRYVCTDLDTKGMEGQPALRCVHLFARHGSTSFAITARRKKEQTEIYVRRLGGART